MTYLVLSAVFLAVALMVCAVAALVPPRRTRVGRWWAPIVGAAALLLVLTAIFDNLMIALGVMAYAPGLISGVTVGSAPVEDFAYPVAAVVLLPALWSLLGRGGRHDR